MATEILIILLLIILNGILSASEIAIVSSRKARLQAESDKNNKSAELALDLKSNPNNFLSTVQIGITLIGILTGFFSGGSISTYLATVLNEIPLLAPYSAQISVALVVLVITYFSLVIGELVPKRIGMAIPETYAMLIAYPMTLLSKIMKPFVWLLSASTDFIVKLLNIKTSKNTVTEEEIKALMDEGVDSGIIEDYEHDMIDRMLTFGDKKAINLMTHRSDITYLDLENTFEENRALILENEHTEYPVCDGNFDNIKGVVHVKTLLKQYLTKDEFNLEKLIQPIPFVNENSYAYSVMEMFRNSTALQAVVIDEYGTPQGIITLKDLVSGIVGGNETTKQTTNSNIRRREDGTFIIDGRYQLDDFFVSFNISLSDSEQEQIRNVTTVAGLVFLLLDRVPVEGETINYRGYKFEVLDMDGNRIDKVCMTLPPEDADDNKEFTD
ncbi:hemolysin family protein [Sphingobacterium hungaricum]|uniref:HlyC/CorC family transporter n=1 Tax=Sphingobacterium hungaricum TaxID=2082723 RepID=A0A928V2D3_9SPHI|nr:hemolysin family protein [Sphingobacterium hungaricum]MBE8715247.1 HlyC/CorC family transporter [Sphingobacterium hungaricum]